MAAPPPRDAGVHAPTDSARPDRRPSIVPPTRVVLPSPPEAGPASARTIGERHPASPELSVTVESVITGEDAEKLWDTYYVNFAPLGELAFLQHVFSRDEIIGELANPRITKIVGWAGTEPVGMGMVTNDLESVPQISPDFLRARYPDHAARGGIYYGILVAVSPQQRGLTLFNRIYTELWQVAAKAGGILAFDICQFNREAFDTDALVERIASNFPDGRVAVADQQTWYIAELPNPID
ncbi:MAG: hypothetical protein HKN44_04335 [Ilumatobacter sp.]|nr:hypothetical protein [Ilumatobacter sp.]